MGHVAPTQQAASCPIREVNVVFDATNVWFNMKRHRIVTPFGEENAGGSGGAAGSVAGGSDVCIFNIDWDMHCEQQWKPLFSDDREREKCCGVVKEGGVRFFWIFLKIVSI